MTARLQPQKRCPICRLKGPVDRHPCRFEVACSCWRGRPCDGSGKIKRKP